MQKAARCQGFPKVYPGQLERKGKGIEKSVCIFAWECGGRFRDLLPIAG